MTPRMRTPELRTVTVDLLRPGMYVHDLKKSWLGHSFWRSRFLIENREEIEQLRNDSIHEVVIDLSKGLDVDQASLLKTPIETRQPSASSDECYQQVVQYRSERQCQSYPIDEERRRILFLRRDSNLVVSDLMESVRVGSQVDVQCLEPVIEKMMGSVMRHQDALIPLLRLKDHNQYKHQHSVSVAALSLAFGATLGFDKQTLREMALGALLHDIGKACTPGHILNKPGRLNDDEMITMREHVVNSRRILEEIPGVSRLALESAAFHHERFDGSGYPYGLVGNKIPLHAQVVAIADAYDAMTSGRCYQEGIEPTDALRRLFADVKGRFREDLLQTFARTVGVYPVGSLVRLNDGYLAVVLEVDRKHLLKPRLRVIYDSRSRCYVPPYELDLIRQRSAPTIVDFESYAVWGIDPERFPMH